MNLVWNYPFRMNVGKIQNYVSIGDEVFIPYSIGWVQEADNQLSHPGATNSHIPLMVLSF